MSSYIRLIKQSLRFSKGFSYNNILVFEKQPGKLSKHFK